MVRLADTSDFQSQQQETDISYRLPDFLIIASILALGALALFSVNRAGDFLYDDVYYADCARSLLANGFYGISGRPETTQPPGVSGILALLCLAGGCTHAVFLSAIAVLETLGFLACYELLRRQLPRAVAGGICLLLMSSSLHFSLATQWVSTCFPLLFTTMGALLAARKLDKANSSASRIAWGCLLSALVAAASMIGSMAIALLGSIVAWIAISIIRDRGLGFARLKRFAAVLLVGIVVNGLWMLRKPPDEWPVPGFPRPYFQQLSVKNGHYPELGNATPRDIAVRIGRKAYEQSVMMTEVLLRRWIDISWMSLLILGPALLLAVGWGYSVWKTGGGLEEWYFAGCEVILFLWPWKLDPRSFLPVAPLACLYVWRGVFGLSFLARNKARALGAIWLPVAAILTIANWRWMHGVGAFGPMRHVGVQSEMSLAAWTLSGILAGWLAWKGSAWVDFAASLADRFSRLMGATRISPKGITTLLGGAVVVSLIVIGVKEQVNILWSNSDSTSAKYVPPDVPAALWVREHTEPNAVVMARQVPTTFHYSGRNMVWFPPSSNAQILMDGIRKYKVNYVILIRRKHSYFLPPEEDCFAAVLKENASSFHLVVDTPEYRIYETQKRPGR